MDECDIEFSARFGKYHSEVKITSGFLENRCKSGTEIWEVGQKFQ